VIRSARPTRCRATNPGEVVYTYDITDEDDDGG
jgi:hypothetical protein